MMYNIESPYEEFLHENIYIFSFCSSLVDRLPRKSKNARILFTTFRRSKGKSRNMQKTGGLQ